MSKSAKTESQNFSIQYFLLINLEENEKFRKLVNSIKMYEKKKTKI